MEMVASWTKGLCVDIAQKQVQNHHDSDNSEFGSEGDKELAAWTVLDVGTGNGLLLQELAKQGYILFLFLFGRFIFLFLLACSFRKHIVEILPRPWLWYHLHAIS